MNPKRQMQRSLKKEHLKAETENGKAIQAIIHHLNSVASEIADFQKLILAMKQVLIERRLISDLDIQSALSAIAEFEEMKRKGLILGEKKDEQSG